MRGSLKHLRKLTIKCAPVIGGVCVTRYDGASPVMSSLWLSSIKLRSFFTFPPSPAPVQPERWTVQQAREWYTRQPWLVGANYIPADRHQSAGDVAGGHLRPAQIDMELGLGREPRHEHDARVPARPALAAGLRRLLSAASTHSSTSQRSTASGRCSCCSIPAGTRCRSWERSARPCRAFTTPAGCKGPGRQPCRIQRNTRACRPM